MELYIPLEGLVDLDKEKTQLNKRKDKIMLLLVGIEKKPLIKTLLIMLPKMLLKEKKLKWTI